MSEGKFEGGEGFGADFEIPREAGQNIDREEIMDTRRLPCGEIEDDDLEIFSSQDKKWEDPDKNHVFISNQDALNAVQKGWLVVEKDGAGAYHVFMTKEWKKQIQSEKESRTIQAQAAISGVRNPMNWDDKKTPNDKNGVRIGNGNKNAKEKNGNGGLKEKSVLGVLMKYDDLVGRFLIDHKSSRVIIFADKARTKVEKEFKGTAKEMIVKIEKYLSGDKK